MSRNPDVAMTLALCLTVPGACASPPATRPEPDPRLCAQSYEFGNSGCADGAVAPVTDIMLRLVTP